jgi:predicted nucleic acid-binding Zn ribbon protein
MMPRPRRSTSLGDALGRLIQDLGLEKKLQDQNVIHLWPRIVGDHIAQHTRAVVCEGGKLFVEVDSAAWRQELHFMKAQILERIGQLTDNHTVKEIILTSRKGDRPHA